MSVRTSMARRRRVAEQTHADRSPIAEPASSVCGRGDQHLVLVPIVPPLLNLQGMPMADDWPLQDGVELGALPSAVPCARQRTRQVLWEWGLEASDQVELIVTELMTNAVKASQSDQRIASIRLWLLSDKQRVAILVWDNNPRLPARIDAALDAESGRGLLLVEALSTRWGSYAHPDWGGKVVWCEISLESPGGEPGLPEAPG